MNYIKINELAKNTFAKHEFDRLTPPSKRRIEVRRCTLNDIDRVCELTTNELPGTVATADVVRGALSYNKNSILAFWNNDKIAGIWAMLMLNNLGLERILLGEFNALNPSHRCLAPRLETPIAIYLWAIVAPGIAAEGMRHASQFLNQPIYRNSNLFSRPATEAGLRLHEGLGFKPIQCGTAGLYRYIRVANRSSSTIGQAA